MTHSYDPLMDAIRIQKKFDRAARHYDTHAFVQEHINQQVIERLSLLKIAPKIIVDLGAGTGLLTPALRTLYPSADILSIDFAHGMLQQLRKKNHASIPICALAEYLPIKGQSVDLLVSSSMLQWCVSPQQVFQACHQVLSDGGYFLFSSYGPDTLCELRAAWQQVDTQVHVNQFIDMHYLGDWLKQSGFKDIVMDRDLLRIRYASVQQVLADIKGIGANYVKNGRKGLTTRSQLQKLYQAYPRNTANKFTASFEVIFGLALNHIAPFKQAGATRIPVDSIPGPKNINNK